MVNCDDVVIRTVVNSRIIKSIRGCLDNCYNSVTAVDVNVGASAPDDGNFPIDNVISPTW